jgi:hypothetical protein
MSLSREFGGARGVELIAEGTRAGVETIFLRICFGILRCVCFGGRPSATGVDIGRWGAVMFKFKVVDSGANAGANGSRNGSIKGKNEGGPSNISCIFSSCMCLLDVLRFDEVAGRDVDKSSRTAFWIRVNCRFLPDVLVVEESGWSSLGFLRQSHCWFHCVVSGGLLRSFEGPVSLLIIVKTECRDVGTDVVELGNGASESTCGSPLDGGGGRLPFENTNLDGSDE